MRLQRLLATARRELQGALRTLDTERAKLTQALDHLDTLVPTLRAHVTVVRQRPKMTPAQRKAVSLRMRKYWAGRRKGAK